MGSLVTRKGLPYCLLRTFVPERVCPYKPVPGYPGQNSYPIFKFVGTAPSYKQSLCYWKDFVLQLLQCRLRAFVRNNQSWSQWYKLPGTTSESIDLYRCTGFVPGMIVETQKKSERNLLSKPSTEKFGQKLRNLEIGLEIWPETQHKEIFAEIWPEHSNDCDQLEQLPRTFMCIEDDDSIVMCARTSVKQSFCPFLQNVGKNSISWPVSVMPQTRDACESLFLILFQDPF